MSLVSNFFLTLLIIIKLYFKFFIGLDKYLKTLQLKTYGEGGISFKFFPLKQTI